MEGSRNQLNLGVCGAHHIPADHDVPRVTPGRRPFSLTDITSRARHAQAAGPVTEQDDFQLKEGVRGSPLRSERSCIPRLPQCEGQSLTITQSKGVELADRSLRPSTQKHAQLRGTRTPPRAAVVHKVPGFTVVNGEGGRGRKSGYCSEPGVQ